MGIKKIMLSFAVLLALLISVCSFASAASAATVSVIDTDGYIGSIIDVKVNISADSKLSAANFDINYDSEKLEYVSYTNGDALTGLGTGNLNEPGNFKFGLATTDPITAEGSLFVVKFEVLSAAKGGADISVIISGPVDENSKSISITAENGKVNVLGEITSDNTVVDNNGSTIGTVNDEGAVIDSNGSQIGITATDSTKSEAAASLAMEESSITKSAEENSGITVESSAESSGSSFKIEQWMIYTALGVLFLAFVLAVIIMIISRKKKQEKTSFDKYEKVYDNENDSSKDSGDKE